MEPLLDVQNLTVSYGTPRGGRRVALNGASFTVAPGEAIGLLGESGCRKTTLALTLLNLLPHSGHVLGGLAIFRGSKLLDLGRDELQKVRGVGISMLHQEPGMALNPVIRVGDQVAEVVRAHLPISPLCLRKPRLLSLSTFLRRSHFRFLGLGIGEPVPSWGNMLAGLQRYYVLESYWWMLASALALVPVFLFYHWLADALQSRLAAAESRSAS
jgi:ABC-type dipeptide/oligopeptide/nickel transport system ATPase component